MRGCGHADDRARVVLVVMVASALLWRGEGAGAPAYGKPAP
jgi:hypothetical protein